MLSNPKVKEIQTKQSLISLGLVAHALVLASGKPKQEDYNKIKVSLSCVGQEPELRGKNETKPQQNKG